jgi:hypothetical protein
VITPHGDFNIRNAALGLGDANDRAYPDQVVIPRKDDVAHQHSRSLDDRFAPIHVRQVSMSKLHSGAFLSGYIRAELTLL